MIKKDRSQAIGVIVRTQRDMNIPTHILYPAPIYAFSDEAFNPFTLEDECDSDD